MKYVKTSNRRHIFWVEKKISSLHNIITFAQDHYNNVSFDRALHKHFWSNSPHPHLKEIEQNGGTFEKLQF